MSKLENVKFLVLTLFISVIVCSCNQNKPKDQITVVGENIDSIAIARDTDQEAAIEGSYEFAKSLSVSENLVYDVKGYGGPPSRGEYAVIKRGADNKPDTVALGARHGIIINAFTADLNKNNSPEVYIIFQSADSFKKGSIIAYEFDKSGKTTNISVRDYSKAEVNEDYRGRDTIYLEHQMIVRQFPVFKKENTPGACLKARYTLKNTELLLNSKEALKHN